MKLTSALFWFAVSLVLGVALVVQWDISRKRQLKLEQLQVQVEKSLTEEKAAKVQVQELEKERMKLTGEMRALEFEANHIRQMAMASNSPAANQLQAALRAPATICSCRCAPKSGSAHSRARRRRARSSRVSWRVVPA